MEISTVNGPMSGQRPPGPPPQAGGREGPLFEEVLQNKDADSDNSLSIDEIGISEEAFAMADLNLDGIIDESEFESGGNKIIGDDLHAQMAEGMPSQMGPPPGEVQPGMGGMSSGNLSYLAMMNLSSGDSSGQDNSIYGQYGTGLENGIDLIA